MTRVGASRSLAMVALVLGLGAVAQDREAAGAAEQAQVDPEVAEQIARTERADRRLEQLLAARFARVQGLGNIDPEVTAGVVTLTGVVDEEPQRELAAKLAENADGVVAVSNRLQFDTALSRRLTPVLSEGFQRVRQWVMALPLALVAALFVLGAWWLGKRLTRSGRLFRRLKNPFLAELLRQAVQVLFVGAGTLVALNLLGATALVSAVLGAAGIVGLALGFAFRDVVENYIAGILLSLRQPFAPDDHVVIEGHEGRVATLTSRATSLITLDGNHLRLPNATVFKGVILNYTRNPTRLYVFELTMLNTVDIEAAQRTVLKALQETPGTLSAPSPAALVQNLTDTGICLSCSGWVDQRSSNFYKVRSGAIRRTTAALDRIGALPDRVRRVEFVPRADDEQSSLLPLEHLPDDVDVSVEDAIDEQLQSERRVLANQNLLRPDAPRE